VLFRSNLGSPSAFRSCDSEHVILCVRTSGPDAPSRTDTLAVFPVDSNSSQPALAISPDGYLQVAWCYRGKVYHCGCREPLAPATQGPSGQSRWFPLELVSAADCGSAIDCSIEIHGERLAVTWRTAADASGAVSATWQRAALCRPGERPQWTSALLCISCLESGHE
jgi:hypothetical protein